MDDRLTDVLWGNGRMSKVILILVGFGVVICFGCAHGRALGGDVQNEFYTCRHYSITDAERNLVSSGFPVSQRGDGWVQTGYLQMSESGAAMAILLGARATASYRLSARQLGSDVKWSAFELITAQAVNGLAASNAQHDEKPLPDLTTQHVQREDTRSVLNRLRRAVCGGDDYFSPNGSAIPPPRSYTDEQARHEERADLSGSKKSAAPTEDSASPEPTANDSKPTRAPLRPGDDPWDGTPTESNAKEGDATMETRRDRDGALLAHRLAEKLKQGQLTKEEAARFFERLSPKEQAVFLAEWKKAAQPTDLAIEIYRALKAGVGSSP
jgi:hypothetical protein